MSLAERFRQAAQVLLAPSPAAPQQEASVAEPPRRKRRKQRPIQQPTRTIVRWYHADLEFASMLADTGNLQEIGRLRTAITRDGVVRGLLTTRCGGLVRLPRRFAGHPEVTSWLEGADGAPGVFDWLFPAAELRLLNEDGVICGVGVGEFVQADGWDLPQFRRLDPQWLRYRWDEDRWQYQSTSGLLDIEPGNGRWVLHLPGGANEPWKNGAWPSLGRAYISKESAINYRENYAGKLANAARVAVAPQGASQEQKQSWFESVMAWGVNTVFGLTPGYDVKLLESNGRGHEVFHAIVEHSNNEFMIELVGQLVTQTGGVGFANSDMFKLMLAERIDADGRALADTISTQGLEPVIWRYLGAQYLNPPTRVAWDTRPPADLKAAAETISAAAKAIVDMRAALDGDEEEIPLDTREILAEFGIPVRGDLDGDARPDNVGTSLLRRIEQMKRIARWAERSGEGRRAA